MEKIGSQLQYHWHALYVKSRTEKKAEAELQEKQIEVYLPLQRKLRQWSDRKKWVDMPLIPGYIFVRISQLEYDKVLQSNYVVSYVRFEGKAACIPDNQIEYLKLMLSQEIYEIEIVQDKFEPGQIVEVISGPMIGVHGKLIRINGKKKVAVELEELGYSCLIEIPVSDVRVSKTKNNDQQALN
jgi:transcription antitermination factor NusG